MRSRAIDETGNVYGALTVIERVENSVHRMARWLCQCICGNTVVVNGVDLRNGGKRDCGCLSKKKNYNYGGGRSLIDLTGQVFGNLTVMHQVVDEETGGKHWRCLCTCGRTRLVTGGVLRAGRANSCGVCPRSEDLAGRAFGKLTVIRRNGDNDIWVCRCVCGSTRSVCGTSLKNGATKNCGHKGLCGVLETAAFMNVYRSYTWNAERRDIEFALTEDQFRELTKMSCCYCGCEPRAVSKSGRSEYVYNGIDRADNDKGYTVDNCVPCCTQCNKMKGNLTVVEFLSLVGKIYKFQHV